MILAIGTIWLPLFLVVLLFVSVRWYQLPHSADCTAPAPCLTALSGPEENQHITIIVN